MDTPLPPDPWAVLGVTKQATSGNIKTAYRKLVLQTHPDKVQDETLRPKKADEFHKVQQAYEILTDDNKRREYDAQVRAEELKKKAGFDAFSGVTGIRVEVRTAAPSSDYERTYRERRANRSADDEDSYFAERSSARKHDIYNQPRRTSRGFDDRKAARAVDDERERMRMERERQRATDREMQSERRRNRDRDRRRGHDEKWSHAAPMYEDDDDLARHRFRTSSSDETIRRSDGHGRRLSEDTGRKDSGRRSRVDDDDYEAKLYKQQSSAREYMDRTLRSTVVDDVPMRPSMASRSSTTYYKTSSGAPLSPVDDSVRRSSARRSERPRTSRKESVRETIIVEPPETSSKSRSRGMPNLPHSTSSPASIKLASHPRRAETFNLDREPVRSDFTLSRSSTMPVNASSRKRDHQTSSSKLKHPIGEPVDSGYSSPGTPETPTLHGRQRSTSPQWGKEADFVIIEEAEPPSYSRRHRKAHVEEDDYDRTPTRHTRSPSPLSRGSSKPTRPSLFGEMHASSSKGRRSESYIYDDDIHGPLSPRPAAPSFSRKESSTSRASPLARAASGLSARAAGGDSFQYSPQEVQFAPRYRKEDVYFTDGRRGSESSAKYRDSPSYGGSSSHYVHGPHLMRAETSR
ncbi:MAG: hypothetical protein M1817_004884 [Caeruleum heppii]|nr:MAG: hypothetical protein M1817_004884 [Caeruleum heppii]